MKQTFNLASPLFFAIACYSFYFFGHSPSHVFWVLPSLLIGHLLSILVTILSKLTVMWLNLTCTLLVFSSRLTLNRSCLHFILAQTIFSLTQKGWWPTYRHTRNYTHIIIWSQMSYTVNHPYKLSTLHSKENINTLKMV